MKKFHILIAFLFLSAGAATYWLVRGASETRAEEQFLAAYRSFRSAESDQYKQVGSGEAPDPIGTAVRFELLDASRLSAVRIQAMQLRPELKKLALEWAEAKSLALRLQAKEWRAMYECGQPQNDVAGVTRAFDEYERQTRAAEDARAKADRIFDQLLGAMDPDTRREIMKL